ncbi:hypothetical protein MRX96_032816 [Rhipicephalus microplus]
MTRHHRAAKRGRPRHRSSANSNACGDIRATSGGKHYAIRPQTKNKGTAELGRPRRTQAGCVCVRRWTATFTAVPHPAITLTGAFDRARENEGGTTRVRG